MKRDRLSAHPGVEAARASLREQVEPHDRTGTVPLERADARVLAETVTADRNVPHYRRAAMDGYAVRATDVADASEDDPVGLRETTGTVGSGEAVAVPTGAKLPEGADTVARVEKVQEGDGEITVVESVTDGKDVAPVGEDVEAGDHLFDPGHQLRPSDIGLLRSLGVGSVAVLERPTVAVIPTGEELVDSDPDPGEVVETNGLTVSRLVERFGGRARYRDIVTDDTGALRAAIRGDLSADVVATTGGSSVGERDLLPDVVSEMGELFVEGVRMKPGHPVTMGVVEGTPILVLPGYPVSAVVGAVQFLRSAVVESGGLPDAGFRTVQAELTERIDSDPGITRFERVHLQSDGGDWRATPVDNSGAGALSSVTLADGWVVVDEERETVGAGESVVVEEWEERDGFDPSRRAGE